jgi:hypothetical protein
VKFVGVDQLHAVPAGRDRYTRPLLGATSRKSGQADSGRPGSTEQANARSHLAPGYAQFFSLTRNVMSFILCR